MADYFEKIFKVCLTESRKAQPTGKKAEVKKAVKEATPIQKKGAGKMKILQEGENIAAVINLNQLDEIISLLSGISKNDFDADEDIVTLTLTESRVKLDRLIKKLTKK